MKLDLIQVKKVAKLANLPLSVGDDQTYSQQLSKILDYIDQLNSVDTSTVEPTYNVSGTNISSFAYNVSGLSNIESEDQVEESLTQDQAIHNAPEQKDGQFVTKGVFEDE